jgi:hypothetical protein
MPQREGRGNLSGGTRARIKLNPLNMIGGQNAASDAEKAVAGTQPTESTGTVPPRTAQFVAANLGSKPKWYTDLFTNGQAGLNYAKDARAALQSQADFQNQFTGNSMLEDLRNKHAVEAAALKDKHDIELANLNSRNGVLATAGLRPEDNNAFTPAVQPRVQALVDKSKADSSAANLATVTNQARTRATADPAMYPEIEDSVRQDFRHPGVSNRVAERTADAAYGNMLANKGRNVIDLNRLQNEREVQQWLQQQPFQLSPFHSLVPRSFMEDRDTPYEAPGHENPLQEAQASMFKDFLGKGNTVVGNGSSVEMINGMPARRRANAQAPQSNGPATTPRPQLTPPRTAAPPQLNSNFAPSGDMELAPINGLQMLLRNLNGSSVVGQPFSGKVPGINPIDDSLKAVYPYLNAEAKRQIDARFGR